jgi:hypothetical protein
VKAYIENYENDTVKMLSLLEEIGKIITLIVERTSQGGSFSSL